MSSYRGGKSNKVGLKNMNMLLLQVPFQSVNSEHSKNVNFIRND